MRARRHVLDNGLILLVSENHRLPLISIDAFVLAGVDQNPLDRPGISALTSRLVTEGTRKYGVHEIYEIIENTGGNLTTFCERELSGISLLTPSQDLGLGLDLLQEILAGPTFPEDRFQLEKKKVLSQLQAMGDDPQTVAAHRLRHWIYQGSPLQHPVLGVQKSLNELQVDQLKKFHRQQYSPQSTILVIVGAVDSKDVISQSEARFSNWKNPHYTRVKISPFERQETPIIDEVFMEKEQITILLGHLGVTRNNPDYYALQVMDIILGCGPGFTSRIPRKLRDEQGLAYSTYSSITHSSGFYPGSFVASISTSPENRQQALEGLLYEIENLAAHGVTSEELATAQDFLTGSFVFKFQSDQNVAQFLLATELFKLGEDYPEQYPQFIRDIDCEDIKRVARQYLDTVNYTTVIVGPTHGERPTHQS
ncbi:MAG: M16 family metallopeptidase [Acidobacteriota bacterium]